MSLNEIVPVYFFSFLIASQVLSKLSSTVMNEYVVDRGQNVTINCSNGGPVMWIKKVGNDTFVVKNNYTLFITNVTVKDAGLYICISNNAIINNSDFSNSINDNVNSFEHLKINLNVKTPPGPVTKLDFKASTIVGYLIWRFNKTNSGGYPLKSFTAEYRNITNNGNTTSEWSRLDPINISPNVRQMEVYHLLPNSTYEFRIWANNQLGSGDIVAINVTTLPEIKEEDLVRLLQADIDNFDPRVWIAAVSIFFGTLLLLATGLCIVLTKEINESSTFASQDDEEEGLDSIELVPNIILNPGFRENEPEISRTFMYRNEEDDYDDEETEEDEPPMEAFKRKVSIFFTGHTIKRI